jgi:hypothetical protein
MWLHHDLAACGFQWKVASTWRGVPDIACIFMWYNVSSAHYHGMATPVSQYMMGAGNVALTAFKHLHDHGPDVGFVAVCFSCRGAHQHPGATLWLEEDCAGLIVTSVSPALQIAGPLRAVTTVRDVID